MTLSLAALCAVACAAEHRTHTVQRGETFAGIAAMYGVAESDIINDNDSIGCYPGVVLRINTDESDYTLAERRMIYGNSQYAEASALCDRGEYKKAIKIYDRLISDGRPALMAYYGRGTANFRRGKMRQAIEDLGKVCADDRDGLYPDASSLLDDAISIQAERDAARAEMWSGIGEIFASAAVVAVSAYAASQAPASGDMPYASYDVPYDASYDDSSYSSGTTSSGRDEITFSDVTCSTCNGTGLIENNNATTFGLDGAKYCSVCDKTVDLSHSHRTCPSCGGKKTVRKRD